MVKNSSALPRKGSVGPCNRVPQFHPWGCAPGFRAIGSLPPLSYGQETHRMTNDPYGPEDDVSCHTGVEKAGHPLLFIQIFARNIILRHLMRADFLLISVPCVFHALHHFALQRFSFLYQLVATL